MSRFGDTPVGPPQRQSGSRFGDAPATAGVGGPDLDRAPPNAESVSGRVLQRVRDTAQPVLDYINPLPALERAASDFGASGQMAGQGVADIVERPFGSLKEGNVLTGIPRVGFGGLGMLFSPVSGALAPITDPVLGPVAGAVDEYVSKPIERATDYPADVTTPALLQLLTAGAAKGARGAVPQTSHTKALLADRLMQHDIPVYPGQLADAPVIRGTYDLADKLSVYDNGAKTRQADAITRTMARTMGEDTPDLREGLVGVRDRLGGANDPTNPMGPKLRPGTYDEIYRRIGEHNFDNVALHEIALVDQRSMQLSNRSRATVENAIDNVMSVINNGRISIRGFKDLTDQGGALAEIENNPNPAVAQYGMQLRTILERNIRRQASPRDSIALQQADAQWRHMKTLEPAIARSADAEGQISVARLQNDLATATQRTNARNASGMNELEMLAEAGQSFLKPPRTSGTAERTPIANILMGGAGGTIGAALATGSPAALAPFLTALALPPTVRRALQSQPLARAMIAKAIQRGTQPSALRRAIINAVRDARVTVPAGVAASQAEAREER